MQIEAIQALDGLMPALETSKPQAAQADFGTWLSDKVSTLDNNMKSADVALRDLATGQADNVHSVMIAMEEAKLSMQFAVEVRNRLVEAYHELMRMQM